MSGGSPTSIPPLSAQLNGGGRSNSNDGQQHYEYSPAATTNEEPDLELQPPQPASTPDASSLRSGSSFSSSSDSHGAGDSQQHSHGGHHGNANWIMQAFGCLGIIYGDIGTSPLYVFSSIFVQEIPSQDDVMGALSLILWSLLLLCTFKYVVIILRADADGEGGTFALLTLIKKGLQDYARDHKYLRYLLDKKENEWKTADGANADAESEEEPAPPMSTSERLGGYFFVRVENVMTIMSFIAAGLLVGDGVLTPAISILSAVEGIAVQSPSLQPSVIPIALIIILVLFMCQRFGTAKVSVVFTPVMVIWFGTLFILGLINLAQYPAVLQALSPHHGVMFFVRRRSTAWLQLGAVILCVTGAEAMYADLGHFGTRPVRASWLCAVLPALLSCYAGQAAMLCKDPTAIDNTFFRSIPSAIYYPMLLLSTAATVIASQALISGSFSLISAGIRLNFLPHLRLNHTSGDNEGQIYIPSVNYALMFSTLIMVVAFRSSAALANAYGLAVCFVMFFTTIMFASVIIFVWRKPLWILLAWCIPFLFIDLAFTSANAMKVFSGGYMPCIFAFFLTSFMYVWHWGRTQIRRHSKVAAANMKRFLNAAQEVSLVPHLQHAFRVHQTRHANKDDPVVAKNQIGEDVRLLQVLAANSANVPSEPLVLDMSCIGIFLSSSEERIPHGAWQLLARLRSFPSRAVFLTIRFTTAPKVDPKDRMHIRTVYTTSHGRKCAQEYQDFLRSQHDVDSDLEVSPHLDRFELYRVVCSYGFAEKLVNMNDIIEELFPKLEALQNLDALQAEAALAGPDVEIDFEAERKPNLDRTGSASESIFHLSPRPVRSVPTATTPRRPRTASGAGLIPPSGTDQPLTVAPFPITYFLSTETLVSSDEPDIELTAEHNSLALSPTGAVRTQQGVTSPSVLTRIDRWIQLQSQSMKVALFNLIARNSDSAVAYFQIPTNQVVEMGARVKLPFSA